jgi:hypothetical protein
VQCNACSPLDKGRTVGFRGLTRCTSAPMVSMFVCLGLYAWLSPRPRASCCRCCRAGHLWCNLALAVGCMGVSFASPRMLLWGAIKNLHASPLLPGRGMQHTEQCSAVCSYPDLPAVLAAAWETAGSSPLPPPLRICMGVIG